MRSDAELLSHYSKLGDQAAFAELVHRHLPLVYRAALRQLNGDTHRAMDVAQQVFLAVARQSRALVRHPNLTAWLYSATHRITCQAIRTEMRRTEREKAWAQANSVPEPTPPVPWSAITPVLDDAVRALGRLDRDAILLRFFNDRSFAEVGSALHLSEDAARMRVNRALGRLREELATRGIAVATGPLAAMLTDDAVLGAPSGLAGSIATTAETVTPAAFSTSSLVVLMSAPKLVPAMLALLAAIALGLATQQWSTARITAAELEQEQTAVAQLRAELNAWEQKGQAPSVAGTIPQPAAPRPSLDDYFEQQKAKGDRFLAAHPEVRSALAQFQRAKIRGKYLSFYRERNLSHTQIIAFEDALIGTSGVIRDDVGTLTVGTELKSDEMNTRLREILGDESFARFQAVRTYEPLAQRIAARLSAFNEPLSPDTCNAIRTILECNYVLDRDRENQWGQALTDLAQILSPSQIDAVRGVVAQERYLQAASVRPTK